MTSDVGSVGSVESLFGLAGRVAVVTGGATGIGEGIVRRFASSGAHVVVADRDLPGAERVASEVGGEAAELDVTDADAVDEVLGSVGDRIDVLVNNAGSYRDVGPILDLPVEAWRRSIEVNLASVFHCSQAVARRMVDQGDGGAIVNIASVDGMMSVLGTSYDTAKAGVIHFTRTLAVDLAPHGIRVNCVSPGVIEVETLRKIATGELDPLWPSDPSPSGLMNPITRQRSANIPLGRRGGPDDIATVVQFLASDAASYVTGQNLPVDGG